MNSPQRCLVLGGQGFMGSHLVDALLVRGHRVRIFDRPHVSSPGVTREPCQTLEEFAGDFASEADVREAVNGCDICFHLISATLPRSSNADPEFDIETNLLGTVRLLNHAVKVGLKKIVFLSSGGTVYGLPTRLPIDEQHPTNPICSYGITKLAIEKYLGLYRHLHGLPYAVLRLANPFGERQRTQASQGAVAVFLGKALRGETIEIWGDGSAVRDYFYVSDAIAALLAVMAYQGNERVFNIGSGHGISINEVLAGIEQVTGQQTLRRYTERRLFDVPSSVLAIDLAKRELGWLPQIPFLEGLARTAQWLMTHLDQMDGSKESPAPSPRISK